MRQYKNITNSVVLGLEESWTNCYRSDKTSLVPAVVWYLLPRLLSTEGLMSLLWIIALSSYVAYTLTTASDRVQTERRNLEWRDSMRSSQAVKRANVCIGQPWFSLITYCWRALLGSSQQSTEHSVWSKNTKCIKSVGSWNNNLG